MKEIKLEKFKIERKRKKLTPETLKKYAPKQPSKKVVLMLFLGIFFACGVIYLFAHDYISMFLTGNNCTDGTCVQAGGLFGSLGEDPQLKQSGDLTNVLLVGIDTREDQPGLMNTDTLMVISINHSNNSVAMISLPRDLYVKIPAKYPYWSRINSVYLQGTRDIESGENEHDKGMQYLQEVVEDVTGLEMQYHVMINYEGFKELIDALGGVDIDVQNEFWGQYPKGLDWEQVHFEKGWQHMDGDTALKYARTRYANAESGEATDFARAKRQQIVITAAKDKLLKLETMLNPIKLAELARIAGDNIKTSPYNQEDVRAALQLAQSLDNSNITNVILDPSIAGGTLIGRLEGEAYILGPVQGTWDGVQNYVQSVLYSPGIVTENAKIYVYNGGGAIGAAGEIAELLIEENPQLSVIIGGNMVDRDFTGTTIYDFSNGAKSVTIHELLRLIPEAEFVEPNPENVDNSYGEDIVIVVGGEPGLSD